MPVKYTHKTRSGLLARIIATDIVGECPVAVAVENTWADGERILMYADDLSSYLGPEWRLVEYSHWNDVVVDTKILVRNRELDEWNRRYFSHYANGIIYAFDDGATSWSGMNTFGWKDAKLAE